MPYKIVKQRNRSCYAVVNLETKHRHSKCTSMDKAKRQLRLLNAIEHGWTPGGSKRKSKKSKSRKSKSRKSKNRTNRKSPKRRVRKSKRRSRKPKSRKSKK